jgi:hypothetical protein
MWRDDEELLAALTEAVHAAPAVPRDFVEAGKAAYDWRAIDAELAMLTYDSATGLIVVQADTALAGIRADPAVLRALTFASARLVIELQIGSDGLLGQVAPPAPGQLQVQFADGAMTQAEVDEVGWFEIRPAPATPFRLRIATGSGSDVLTGWVTP